VARSEGAHHEGMESIPIIQVFAFILDPIVVGAAAAVSLALLTGLGARAAELYERYRAGRVDVTRTGGPRSAGDGRPVGEAT
jgi:hypothetical protein